MPEHLGETESLCPVCFAKIPGKRTLENNNVFLDKTCREHGNFKVLLWRDARLYKEWGDGEDASGPEKRFSISNRGCPYDCGLCPNHKAETCTVLMEVTNSCDMNCPVCFASSRKNPDKPSIGTIRKMYQTVMESGGPYPVQLSGGEPTIRDDLPDIVTIGKKMGFYHIQVNTHGLRLAKEKEYLKRLKDSGVDLIYLQFDGVSDDVYRFTRGANIFDHKFQAIQNCLDLKIGVTLVPTLVPGINDHQIGDIVRFAKEWIPIVKGIHFQPITYFGRYPKSPEDRDRITIPDVLRALEVQTQGEVKARNFVPRRRKDSHCGFSGFFVLTKEKKLKATVDFHQRKTTRDADQFVSSPAEHVRSFMDKRGRFVEKDTGCCKVKEGSLEEFFKRSETHYLSISGMPFQDVWTVDLERLEGCCIHVVTPSRQLIPFCSFYITNMNGDRLHQSKYQRKQSGA
ncbi:MAG: radical SAM (seleno)protein TrsS [Thermodesulfobacteriota bacterium]